MYERLSHCPICNSEDFENKIICRDYLVSNESFVIVGCRNCSFQFTNPRPKAEELGKFYQSEDYISHSNTIRGVTDLIYKIARYFSLKRKVRLIEKYVKVGSILDYGCGTGAFLKSCKQNHWNVTGVEPQSSARAVAKKSIASVEEKIQDLTEKSFDIITLWHVLEHVSDLNELVIQLKNKLTKSGKLVIAVPNRAAQDQKIYNEYWAAYDVPRHLYHFDQHTIKELMSNHKLKLIDTLPLKLDSYYVSLLSEQHLKKDKKNKGNKYYNAIVNGFKSNTYAKNHHNNYSSLIYVFEK